MSWSILAHVAVVVIGTLWAFSYYIDDTIEYQRDWDTLYVIRLYHWGLCVWGVTRSRQEPYLRWRRTVVPSGIPYVSHRDSFVKPVLNIGVLDLGIVRGARYSAVALLCWFLVLIPAVPLAIREGRLLRRKRCASRGLCLHCGYDLRASGDRCPECGTARLAAGQEAACTREGGTGTAESAASSSPGP